MRKTYLPVAIVILFTMSALLAIRFFFLSWNNLLSKRPIMQIQAPRENNAYIPARYTCDANDEVPNLTIKDIPQNTKTLALIVDDPDAPVGNRDHYLLANIPIEGNETGIKLGTQLDAIVGKNSRGRNDRGWPCPPNGVHRYFFKIYALDQTLDIKKWFTKEHLLKAMDGHIITQTELIGLYQRQ